MSINGCGVFSGVPRTFAADQTSEMSLPQEAQKG